MKRLVEFPLQAGGSMIVEADQPAEEGIAPAARRGEVAEKAAGTFDEAIDRVKPAAEGIISRFGELSARPDEIHLEFGIAFSAAAGAFVARTAVEGNFQVSLTWRPDAEGRSVVD